MLPYCIPLLYDALPAPNNPASHPLSGPGVAIPLPRCTCSKRGFSGMPYSTARTKPETPFRRSAELDFGFLPVATPAGMHTCYPELQLSTHAAGLIAYHLSCETLPELLQKPRVSAETQLRTSAARTLPRAALILSGVSSQTGASPTLSIRAPNQKPRLAMVKQKDRKTPSGVSNKPTPPTPTPTPQLTPSNRRP